MDWNVKDLSRNEASKLLHSTIMPRPIAFVTTLNADGSANAAPFSFFNVLCTQPAIVAIGFDGDVEAEDGLKDTARNIAANSEFVINLVDEGLVEAMNICSIDFPSGVDETVQAGLDLVPSRQVRTPRIANSPVQFECRVMQRLPLVAGRCIVLGEIVHMHIRDDIVDARFHVDVDKLNVIGRMHGAGWYTRTSSLFQVPRMDYAQWLARSQDSPST
jgi:flavin reductase (DIM6/NTAB) family NADH-FMN oxidoreductase RutF